MEIMRTLQKKGFIIFFMIIVVVERKERDKIAGAYAFYLPNIVGTQTAHHF